MGLLLGYTECPGQLGGKYIINYYYVFKGKKEQLTAQMCFQKPDIRSIEKTIKRYNSVSFKDLKFSFDIIETIMYGQLFLYLQDNEKDIKKLYEMKDQIGNYIRNTFGNSEIVKCLFKISTLKKFKIFWHKNKKLVRILAILSDNDPVIIFSPISKEEEATTRQTYQNIENQLGSLF